jgi:D-alanine--poly(phosphoribitol) ligase subunit 1
MKGYLDDPEKSALVLIHRPDGQIYYRTGDLCILDGDGDIIYCGRKDYQVKIQGFRIELSEIEYTAQSFFKTPCSVAAVPLLCDGICNELHLAVETTECTQSALIEYLKEKLPKYMLPKQIHCISQFPVTNSNKTDRKKIAELIKEKKL